MKITHVTTRVLSTPADNPLVVGLSAPTDTREFVTLELGTDEGLVGIGLTFFGMALTPALKAAVDTFGALVIGEDPTGVEAITARCRRAASHAGPGGIFSRPRALPLRSQHAMAIAASAQAAEESAHRAAVPDIHVHLIAAIPNGLTVEYMPWSLRLFEETPALEAGQLVVPAKPGLGLAFDAAAIKRYQVA